ncbi:CheY-P-specific phosphatase CheC [Bacillaceae bacterium SIJ1]|uniref:chemotaxis protein CheC n=1 Tax=Litoribacterium kuwaitense TaxID=1398745 RepID=UPI0013E9FD6F|nr:chemotaxis protein CheC [Litoribacterium kuwaitense]NGP44105.1 CheY-P-specific phosphatase CheC [Litoribacterium kuwaitense]
MSELTKLNDIQLDVFKEIGSIGAGHAAKALSELVNRPVQLNVPSVGVFTFDHLLDHLGGADHPILASVFRVEDDVKGWMFVLFEHEAARYLLAELLGETNVSNWEEDLAVSAIGEIGNIVLGAYLTALNQLTGLRMAPSIPNVVFDMVGAVLSQGLAEASPYGNEVLLIDTTFVEADHATSQFLFMPDLESYSRLLTALGMGKV